MLDTTQCNNCFKDWISCGITEINVRGYLTPEVDFVWFIKNKNAIYSGGLTTNSDGQFVIPVSELPAGLLNPYAGKFFLTVNLSGTFCTADEIWNNTAYCESYNCIEFEVFNGTANKNTLGCQCPGP